MSEHRPARSARCCSTGCGGSPVFSHCWRVEVRRSRCASRSARRSSKLPTCGSMSLSQTDSSTTAPRTITAFDETRSFFTSRIGSCTPHMNAVRWRPALRSQIALTVGAAMGFKKITGSVVLFLAAFAAIVAAAGESLDRAKSLYASAAYDEALTVLDQLSGAPAPDDLTSIAAYRVYCLLALDRQDEARTLIDGLLHQSPFFVPSAEEAPPHIQTIFRDVRRATLPKIARERYADAKAAFERKDPQTARQFDELLTLLDDPDLRDWSAGADLRAVASAFRDLAKAVAATPVSPAADAGSVAGLQGRAAAHHRPVGRGGISVDADRHASRLRPDAHARSPRVEVPTRAAAGSTGEVSQGHRDSPGAEYVGHAVGSPEGALFIVPSRMQLTFMSPMTLMAVRQRSRNQSTGSSSAI